MTVWKVWRRAEDAEAVGVKCDGAEAGAPSQRSVSFVPRDSLPLAKDPILNKRFLVCFENVFNSEQGGF